MGNAAAKKKAEEQAKADEDRIEKARLETRFNELKKEIADNKDRLAAEGQYQMIESNGGDRGAPVFYTIKTYNTAEGEAKLKKKQDLEKQAARQKEIDAEIKYCEAYIADNKQRPPEGLQGGKRRRRHKTTKRRHKKAKKTRRR
jgi:hypothetical protein